MVGFLFGAISLQAQVSNQVWFVSWNGQPTPSSDVSVRNVLTAGTTNAIATGVATNFVSQTNFSLFNSPFDIAVDPAMGKVYVLDNNVQGGAPEYIYSFNLNGTPAQIAASEQIIYTMPVPQADITASVYPIISGLALDAANHQLYFCQVDVTTPTNSFIGRLDLASSSKSDAFSSTNGGVALQTFYIGQIPGQGKISLAGTNIYLSAVNGLNGNNGIYAAQTNGGGTFVEIVTFSSGNTAFPAGYVSGVAGYARSNLIYYLTSNAGYVNNNFDTNQNALWVYDAISHAQTKIASGFQGYPRAITLDVTNNHYYLTLGADGTGNFTPANFQAIYTGNLGSTNRPTRFYTPSLGGQDVGANAGNVSVEGIFVVDLGGANHSPVAGMHLICAQKNLSLSLPVADLVAGDFDADGDTLGIAAVSNTSTNGGSVTTNGAFIIYTPVNNFIGKDQFSYTLTDGRGGQSQGTVGVNVLSLNVPSSNHVAVAVYPDDKFILFTGAAGQHYVVQSAGQVIGPWVDLSPNLPADASGFIEYNDLTQSFSVIRFYRLRVGP